MGKYTKQWKAFKKQKKPKKPPTAFAKFVASYYKKVNDDRVEKNKSVIKGPRFFKDASQAWKTLENQQQIAFHDKDSMEKFKESMAEFRKKMTALKKPPESFGLFVKHYWKIRKPVNNGNRKDFGKILKEVSEAWRKLSDEEVEVYKQGAERLKAMFVEEQQAVVNGSRALNVNWRNEGIDKIAPLLEKTQSVVAGSVQAEADDDDADVYDAEINDDKMEENLE